MDCLKILLIYNVVRFSRLGVIWLKIKYKAKVGSYSCKYLKSVLEEKTGRIGHGLEINGGKKVKQQSEWRKENNMNI
jgi:hypothetical protein